MILQKINAGVFNEMVQDETGTFVMNKNQPSPICLTTNQLNLT